MHSIISTLQLTLSLKGCGTELVRPGKIEPRNGASRVKSYLKPSETLSELFAGLVVVLTVTLAASVLGGGDEVSQMALIGAIGANTAWGVMMQRSI